MLFETLYGAYSCIELRKALQERGLKSSGKKADLLARLQEDYRRAQDEATGEAAFEATGDGEARQGLAAYFAMIDPEDKGVRRSRCGTAYVRSTGRVPSRGRSSGVPLEVPLQVAHKTSRRKRRRKRITIRGVRSKDRWAKKNDKRIFTFRMDEEDKKINKNVKFLAVVTEVKTKKTIYSDYVVTSISEVTVKYVDPRMGCLADLHFMEERHGKILEGEDATETTFKGKHAKRDFKGNSHGGKLRFERLYKKRLAEEWKKPPRKAAKRT